MAQEKTTNVSVRLSELVVLLSAAVKLQFINRAKNMLKGTETKDEGLNGAIEYADQVVRQAIGE